MNNNNQNKEILEIKKDIKFYIKQTSKNFIKLILLPIKCILLWTLNLINHLIPLILLIIPVTLEWKVITIIIDVIICQIISKKIDNYVDDQLEYNHIYKTSVNVSTSACNLGESCRKLKKLKQNHSKNEQLIINPEQISNIQQEETTIKENRKYSYSYQPQNVIITKEQKSNQTKKLTRKKQRNNQTNNVDN